MQPNVYRNQDGSSQHIATVHMPSSTSFSGQFTSPSPSFPASSCSSNYAKNALSSSLPMTSSSLATPASILSTLKDPEGAWASARSSPHGAPSPSQSNSIPAAEPPRAPPSASPPGLSLSRSHPLQCGFSFWYLQRKADTGADNYEQAIKKLATFNTVEAFWACYSHLQRPGDLASIDYQCFREGIVPLWEDDANQEGGKWVIRLKKGMANRCWEDTLLALIGDHFHLGEEICGLVISTKYQEDTLSVWNRTSNNRTVILKIRDVLKKILRIPVNEALEYKAHNAAIRHNLQQQQQQLNSPPFQAQAGELPIEDLPEVQQQNQPPRGPRPQMQRHHST